MRDPYLYRHSTVLKNRANIRDEVELKKIEADYTIYRLSELVRCEFKGVFDCKCFCDIHYRIFRDVYEWAGEFRIINIEKMEPVLGEISIEYSAHEKILSEIEEITSEMNQAAWRSMNIQEKTEKFSDYMARLWKVHPYRDGNTRAIVTFCVLFIEAQGSYIDSTLFEENALYMRDALVAATACFQDLGDLRKLEYLYTIVYDALEKGEDFKRLIIEQMIEAKCVVTDESVREIAILNRKKGARLTINEIRDAL